jgi:ribosomal-protein-alanine N-acetyltransferase
MTPIGRARPDDLDALCALEARASVRPWARQVFVEELAREFSHVVVIRDAEALVAFIVYWIVRDELHVLNLATDPAVRRRGHAARLVEHAIAAARRAGGTSVLLEVRRSNRAAIRLYRKYGFRPIGVRAGYYAEEHEDAIVMRLSVGDVPVPPRSA